jgi:hypothetical protein
MIWLGLLLVAVVVLEVIRRERSIGLTMVLASLGFVVSLGVMNVDTFIVRQNVQREIQGTGDKTFTQGRPDLDAQYFLDLSDDAVPALVDAFKNNSLPVNVHEKLGAALACKHYDRGQDTREIPWQSFNVSRYLADTQFAKVERDLNSYKIIDKDWPVKVETPGGEEFSCWQYYSD